MTYNAGYNLDKYILLDRIMSTLNFVSNNYLLNFKMILRFY